MFEKPATRRGRRGIGPVYEYELIEVDSSETGETYVVYSVSWFGERIGFIVIDESGRMRAESAYGCTCGLGTVGSFRAGARRLGNHREICQRGGRGI